MAEYQKFIFADNYSKEPENIERLKQQKIKDARDIMLAEMEAAKKQAFEEGFQEGQKMALDKLKSEMDLHINTIIDNITKINEYKPQLQNIYEQHSTACVRHITKNMFFKSHEMFSEKLLEQSLDNALVNLPMVSKILIKIPTGCKVYLEDTKFAEKITQRGITDFAFIEEPSLNTGESRIEWDQSGLLSSKVESFEKINSTFAAFLSPEDLEVSDNTESFAPMQTTTPEQAEINTTTTNATEELEDVNLLEPNENTIEENSTKTD